MVVAHFFGIRPATPSTLGRVESAPLMAGAVALASTGYMLRSTKRPGRGHVGSPGRPGFPTGERHCPRRQLESRVARRRSSHPLERGLDRSPVAAAGTGCSPANGTPEELRRLARPCVLSIALPLGSTMIYRNVRQKSLGCLRIERNTNILGRPATGRVNFRRIVPESAKRHPIRCIRWRD